MKTLNYVLILAIVGIIACKSNLEKSNTEIDKIEKELSTSEMQKKDSIGNLLLNKYLAHIKKNPGDEKNLEYKYNAGELANALELPTMSVNILEELYTEYPNSSQGPEAMFLSAFIFENKLNNLEKAKQRYELFLETYPKHFLAADAKASLKNLGLSPEELIQKFQNQNQGPS